MFLMPVPAPLVPVASAFTGKAQTSTGATSTHTFSGVATGVADVGRKIAAGIVVSGGSPHTIDTVTIGGVSASKDATAANTASFHTELWQADVPAGTTADVVITLSASQGETWGCALWRVLNAAASVSDTLTNTSEPPTGTIDCPANGVIIGYSSNDDVGATATWAGITEDFDEAAGGRQHSGAQDLFAAAQSGLTITADWTTDAASGLVAISFGPA